MPNSGYYTKEVPKEKWVGWVASTSALWDPPPAWSLGLFMSPESLAGRDVGLSDPDFLVADPVE